MMPKKRSRRPDREIAKADREWLLCAIASGISNWTKATVAGRPGQDTISRIIDDWPELQLLTEIFGLVLPMINPNDKKTSIQVTLRAFLQNLCQEKLIGVNHEGRCAEEQLASFAMVAQDNRGEPLVRHLGCKLFLGVGTMCFFVAREIRRRLLQKEMDRVSIATPSLEILNLFYHSLSRNMFEEGTLEVELSGGKLIPQRGSVMASWKKGDKKLVLDEVDTVILGFRSISAKGVVHTTFHQSLDLTLHALKSAKRVVFVGRRERLDQRELMKTEKIGEPIDQGDKVREEIGKLLVSTERFLITDGPVPSDFDQTQFSKVIVVPHTDRTKVN